MKITVDSGTSLQKLQQFTFVCPPSPFQHACVAAWDYDVSAIVADYRRKTVLADTVTPYLWDDDTLNRFLNNAVAQAT
jgi:aspartate/methionine/tyrosine aminotransferase